MVQGHAHKFLKSLKKNCDVESNPEQDITIHNHGEKKTMFIIKNHASKKVLHIWCSKLKRRISKPIINYPHKEAKNYIPRPNIRQI
jgi:hypothetical protein